ncbi:VirB2 family type IV secretion system major pilin TrwL [Brucella cytisi]|uniref:Conjugal transfer protein n=1 Tax=Brucella cytisi TaxID=407152 RepID=A0A1J6HB26_9HYPH|nr:VirB2 family type IV secretion system major pilin TrwL [Brucella cytisi]OIS90309.1 conjugal transfer protein [Brucella cytisi]
MKIIKSVVRKLRSRVAVGSGVIAAAAAGPASAQGLQKAQGVLETFQSQLTTIVPIAAAVILLCLGVAYAGRFIEKDTFVRWGVGVIIAGSAVQITALLFT